MNETLDSIESQANSLLSDIKNATNEATIDNADTIATKVQQLQKLLPKLQNIPDED